MCVHKICGALLGVMTPCVGSATAYDQLCFGLLCMLFVCVDMFSGILYILSFAEFFFSNVPIIGHSFLGSSQGTVLFIMNR